MNLKDTLPDCRVTRHANPFLNRALSSLVDKQNLFPVWCMCKNLDVYFSYNKCNIYLYYIPSINFLLF